MNSESNTIHASFGYWVRRRCKALDLTEDTLATQRLLVVAMLLQEKEWISTLG